MATTINRNPLPVNDSGNCTDGTPITREWWITHLDAIDAALAGVETQSGKPPIIFPAVQVPSTNPNALDDYEEGTYTPIDASGAGLVFTGPSGAPTGAYCKIGGMMYVSGNMIFPANANGVQAMIGGFPYAALAVEPYWGGSVSYTTINMPISILQIISSGQIGLFKYDGAPASNALMSGHQFRFTAMYRTGQ